MFAAFVAGLALAAATTVVAVANIFFSLPIDDISVNVSLKALWNPNDMRKLFPLKGSYTEAITNCIQILIHI